MRKEYRGKFRMRLAEWLIRHQTDIVFKQCTWMGVKALKNPLDAWIYQEIVHEVQPDVIIEIGSHAGGSTLFFAHLCDLIGKGTVISLDIDRTHYSVEHPRIIPITGDSSSSEVTSQVFPLCEGKRVLVAHDGDHTKEQVLKDLAAYSPLVSVNSYFIVEDGIVDLFRPGDRLGKFEDGPLAAVDEFLSANTDFVVDSSRERYILTYNPHGFLKRIR
jgi:cephalosporin hydroxylase